MLFEEVEKNNLNACISNKIKTGQVRFIAHGFCILSKVKLEFQLMYADIMFFFADVAVSRFLIYM